MQVFIPYADPYLTATALKGDRRFNKQYQEAKQILLAIKDPTKGYANHPVTKMYKDDVLWLSYYIEVFKWVSIDNRIMARFYAIKANRIKPEWMTSELCDQHKRRLYTKNPKHFEIWSSFGESNENWYVVNGELIKYINGKRIWK